MSDPNFRPNRFSADEIRNRIQSSLKDCEVHVQNMNNDGYHFDVIVVWPGFSGMSRVKQHQSILGLFTEDFASNALHAVTIKTLTPETWAQMQAEQSKKVTIQ